LTSCSRSAWGPLSTPGAKVLMAGNPTRTSGLGAGVYDRCKEWSQVLDEGRVARTRRCSPG
jgi:hypothetical protein